MVLSGPSSGGMVEHGFGCVDLMIDQMLVGVAVLRMEMAWECRAFRHEVRQWLRAVRAASAMVMLPGLVRDFRRRRVAVCFSSSRVGFHHGWLWCFRGLCRGVAALQARVRRWSRWSTNESIAWVVGSRGVFAVEKKHSKTGQSVFRQLREGSSGSGVDWMFSLIAQWSDGKESSMW